MPAILHQFIPVLLLFGRTFMVFSTDFLGLGQEADSTAVFLPPAMRVQTIPPLYILLNALLVSPALYLASVLASVP